jgi:hypothetical protein
MLAKNCCSQVAALWCMPEYLKMAYIAGFEKYASKIDKLMLAGKLSDKAWRRFVGDTIAVRFPAAVNPAATRTEWHGRHVNMYGRRGPLEYIRYMHRRPASQASLRTGNLPLDVFEALTSPVVASSAASSVSHPGLHKLIIPKEVKSHLNMLIPPYAWVKNVAGYSSSLNAIAVPHIRLGSASPVVRHELGHWKHNVLSHDNPARLRTVLAMRLNKMRAANPNLFDQLLQKGDANVIRLRAKLDDGALNPQTLNEVAAHYFAASGSRGAAIRAATARNWNSPWADAIRQRFGDDATASVVEHLQRNYMLPGGTPAPTKLNRLVDAISVRLAQWKSKWNRHG